MRYSSRTKRETQRRPPHAQGNLARGAARDHGADVPSPPVKARTTAQGHDRLRISIHRHATKMTLVRRTSLPSAEARRSPSRRRAGHRRKAKGGAEKAFWRAAHASYGRGGSAPRPDRMRDTAESRRLGTGSPGRHRPCSWHRASSPAQGTTVAPMTGENLRSIVQARCPYTFTCQKAQNEDMRKFP